MLVFQTEDIMPYITSQKYCLGWLQLFYMSSYSSLCSMHIITIAPSSPLSSLSSSSSSLLTLPHHNYHFYDFHHQQLKCIHFIRWFTKEPKSQTTELEPNISAQPPAYANICADDVILRHSTPPPPQARRRWKRVLDSGAWVSLASVWNRLQSIWRGVLWPVPKLTVFGWSEVTNGK